MKILTTLIALVLTSTTAFAQERVALPNDYENTFTEYLSLDRTQNPDQFIRLLANDVAMQGKDKSGGLADGSVLVAEVYSVKKNADGSVKSSMLGRRLKDKLLLIAVMEKSNGFAATSKSTIKTGDWDFATYKPNRNVAPKNLDQCRACHAPLTNTDFLFSLEHIAQ